VSHIGPVHSVWIPGPLPGLNEIIDARGHVRGKWNGYMAMKTKWGDRIATMAFVQKFPKITGGYFTYLFVERDRRRDKSNIAGGGVKLIEDGLQEAELLENDGWDQVLEIRPYFTVMAGGAAEHVGVSLSVSQDEPLTFEEAILECQKNRRYHHVGDRVREEGQASLNRVRAGKRRLAEDGPPTLAIARPNEQGPGGGVHGPSGPGGGDGEGEASQSRGAATARRWSLAR
jgi:hypothetical protein